MLPLKTCTGRVEKKSINPKTGEMVCCDGGCAACALAGADPPAWADIKERKQS